MNIKLVLAITLMGCLSHAAVLTCTETAKSAKDYSYGRDLTIEVSADQKEIKIKGAASADYKALEEVVKQNDSDTSNDENGNLDEDYSREKESRYEGSSDIIITDTGTCLFADKNILSGKAGTLRLSSGQGNESDSGPMILWGEAAVLDCK